MEDNFSLSLEELDGDYDQEAEIDRISKVQCGVPGLSIPVEVQTEISIIDVLESKILEGTIVKSVEDAYLLYCQYTHAKGFSVRKGDQRNLIVHVKPITRTNCKAKLKITREKDGEWQSTLEAMVNAGISISSVVSYMEDEACGPENLGFIRKDAYDHLSRLKKHTKVENGDATALIQYFINKANKENYFYWNVQLDDNDKVMNFFFRDYKCAVDYEYFCDVLSIDTTYRTNKYNLICTPFVGIYHHMRNVLFGLAFMSDETESSFEWLFRTFLDSMNEKQPQTIFSDQCQSMMNAIETVFPHSHHRLCQWHINQNSPSHFGSLNGDSAFKNLWHKCMTYCESEDEFEATWKYMVDKYNLDGHKWLNGMYRLRKKWATAFSNGRFSAGLLATSRSKVTNMVLKKSR
ncbi:protein FAR1-RELATED SEQUENCE 5-like [Henckelia pumila]|uniref:protein FAR1-RELATED SEQUENCE 5-like n=1 Tax=Henckelia pumila TaxID=405737 RepID=UPI003C6E978B